VREIAAASPSLKAPHRLPGAALSILKGIRTARDLFRQDRPALVAGFGGYPSFPAMSAANGLKIPILIHEQNAVLGRVNRQFARQAARIACGFETLDRLPPDCTDKKRVTGNPVRAPIMAVADRPLPPTDGPLNVLITGGSQGAHLFGEVFPQALASLPEALRSRLEVVQQVREDQLAAVVATYARAGISAQVDTFFRDMDRRLASAHLVIARAGAGTISEIAVVGRPSILVPLAIAMDDHQTANAGALVDVGAADLVMEENLHPELLAALIATRLGDPRDLRQRAALAKAVSHLDAARDLARLAEEVAG
jgi:UDP-N-acetylglucosamine--N-acetylmuramyl-(pentapeptide) pyrophosphoryl-undecaprenol N-acetylglucosamine transferase